MMSAGTVVNSIMVAAIVVVVAISAAGAIILGLAVIVEVVHALVRNIRDLRRTLKGGR